MDKGALDDDMGRELGIGRRVVLHAVVDCVVPEKRPIQRGRSAATARFLVYDVVIGSTKTRVAFLSPRDRAVRRLLAPAALAGLAAAGALIALPAPANLMLTIALGGLVALALDHVSWSDLQVWFRRTGASVTLADRPARVGDHVLIEGLVVATDRTAVDMSYRIELSGASRAQIEIASDGIELVEEYACRPTARFPFALPERVSRLAQQ